jgi:tol-pal system protein YbgF
MRFFRLSPSLRVLCLTVAAGLLTLPALAQEDYVQSAPSMQQPATTYTETRLSAMEEQMRALNGRVEQIDFAVRRLDQTLQRMQTDNDSRLSRLEQQTTALTSAAAAPPQPIAQPVVQPVVQPTVPGVPLSQNTTQPATSQQAAAPPVDTTANGTLGAIKLQGGQVTGAINNPQAPPLPQVPADYGLTTQEQYDRAFEQLRQANYADAETSFKTFIDKNPKDKLTDNAKYWYGETLYVRGQFDAAAVAFADAYQQNPQGQKAPDSLLKLALSLAALNKTPDACVTLSELKVKYPHTDAAIKSRANEERAKLKCPAH